MRYALRLDFKRGVWLGPQGATTQALPLLLGDISPQSGQNAFRITAQLKSPAGSLQGRTVSTFTITVQSVMQRP
jgi:hypothetical protein